MGVMASQISPPHDCLLNRLFRRRPKKISKLRVTGLCAGNSPVTGEFPAQRASNAENVSFDDVIMILWVVVMSLPLRKLFTTHSAQSSKVVVTKAPFVNYSITESLIKYIKSHVKYERDITHITVTS